MARNNSKVPRFSAKSVEELRQVLSKLPAQAKVYGPADHIDEPTDIIVTQGNKELAYIDLKGF